MAAKAAVLAAFLALNFTGSARADTVDLLTSGQWTAFGGTDNGGHEVCGMLTTWKDGRSFLIKRYEGDKHLVVQAIKNDWNLDSDGIDTSLTIGDHGAWTATSSVMAAHNGVEFSVPPLKAIDFINEFTSSGNMVLVMGNNHVTWNMGLDGSDTIAQRFSECIGIMTQ